MPSSAELQVLLDQDPGPAGRDDGRPGHVVHRDAQEESHVPPHLGKVGQGVVRAHLLDDLPTRKRSLASDG